MKKVTLFLLLLVASINTIAQTEIEPIQVIFNCDGSKVTLKTAKTEGVKQTNTINVEAIFSKSELSKLNSPTISFEFKWYYFMSTKKTLMGTNLVNVNISEANKDGLIKVLCEKKNTRQGWWEVQIRCKTNDSQILFAGTKEYQILLK
ncbi:MAG: hypothetical protein MJ211_07710 [Bacteroidales bacterium]|nr:hypothetical protein [Bacteroidales bacterium]